MAYIITDFLRLIHRHSLNRSYDLLGDLIDENRFYQMIEESPDRLTIRTDLQTLFEENDVRKIDRQDLKIFITDVLPWTSPGMLRRRAKRNRDFE